jgi:hypothetical protein
MNLHLLKFQHLSHHLLTNNAHDRRVVITKSVLCLLNLASSYQWEKQELVTALFSKNAPPHRKLPPASDASNTLKLPASGSVAYRL